MCTLGVEFVKLVIDCSSVLAVHPEVKVAQLQAIQFHSTRLCYQGRRRVFKSGPAEEAIECRGHERGESTRGGLFPSC